MKEMFICSMKKLGYLVFVVALNECLIFEIIYTGSSSSELPKLLCHGTHTKSVGNTGVNG